MSTTKASTGIFLLSFALAGCSAPQTSSPPTELNLENLLRQSLAEEFIPDREIIVSHVEIPPNTTLNWHWHPGEEFHYYLDGEVEIAIEGAPSIFGTPGTVGHVPLRKTHRAIAGPNGARILVFRVHTEGEPIRHIVEDHEDDDGDEHDDEASD